ncbi:MAG: NAD(P)-dependent alcohol dehydrogenase [Chloroflexi bacterium]|nr:NAD(P)-dependent alcohol dehydrogenase [Chloroflexota bacterium]
MKAIVCTAYGSPDVLKLQELARPAPKDNEVLVKVHTAVVGPADCAFRKGDPFIVRLIYGLRKPRIATQGAEFAGQIVAVGSAVTQFKPGDRVCGLSPDSMGAHAEYLCIPEDKPIIHTPEGMSEEEAVGIIDGAATALTFLKAVAHLQPGQSVLINGASGSVGAYGVQIAKAFGAQVTGVCSTANVELVRSLGADHVIDYTQTDFTRTGQTYDVIFDAVGKSTFGKCKRALKPRGQYLTTVPTLSMASAVLRTALFGRRKAKFTTAGLKQTKARLTELADLFAAGKLRAVIDRRYPLDQVPEAHRYVDTGRKRGNVIITVAPAAA